ncbi:MAG: hypothetical protein ACR2OJ_08110 [Hyphomicrobiales bacterium]
MADDSTSNAQDFEDHKETYEGFIAGCISISLACFFILVCLVINGFSGAGAVINLAVSLFGLVLGLVFLAVEVKAGSSFMASTVLLVLYGILAVFMVA